jgi:fatty acid desaturase
MTETRIPDGVLETGEPLDGGKDVLLAPVRGPDTREKLADELFVRNPRRFAAKFLFAMAVIAGCWALVALGVHPALTVVAMLVAGLMYGHLVELQHETLHEHGFNSRRWNRVVGFVCGLFMFSSFSHYKYEHLRHHAFLGTPRNQEFFNYRVHGLDSVPGFLRGAFDLGRYVDVVANIGRSLLGRRIPGVARQSSSTRKIQTEYRIFTLALVAGVAFTVVTDELLLLLVWLIPALVVAEATHFMIELPEHFGLNTQTDDNVLTNTRTINASRIAQWFTNYNNFHTAHHYHQGVPMVGVPRLSKLVYDKFEVIEPSYWSFYRKVVRGDLRYTDEGETCMTR